MSDGLVSYTIFLYADGLIQWSSVNDYFGFRYNLYAQVGINAGDYPNYNYISHEYSLTREVMNITQSRVPENAMAGMLVYKVDGQNTSENCDFFNDGMWWGV